MGRPCATEVSAITRIRRRGRHRRYGRGGLSSGPSRCSASISLQRATQSLQIATPGPARTASTCPAVLEQNEHWRVGSEPWSRGSVSKDRLGRTGLGRTGSNLTGLLPSALGQTQQAAYRRSASCSLSVRSADVASRGHMGRPKPSVDRADRPAFRKQTLNAARWQCESCRASDPRVRDSRIGRAATLSCGLLLGDSRWNSVGLVGAPWRPHRSRGSSELEPGARVHHRCLPAVHCPDDLLR